LQIALLLLSIPACDTITGGPLTGSVITVKTVSSSDQVSSKIGTITGVLSANSSDLCKLDVSSLKIQIPAFCEEVNKDPTNLIGIVEDGDGSLGTAAGTITQTFDGCGVEVVDLKITIPTKTGCEGVTPGTIAGIITDGDGETGTITGTIEKDAADPCKPVITNLAVYAPTKTGITNVIRSETGTGDGVEDVTINVANGVATITVHKADINAKYCS
jgi:hypothetical protein